VEVRIGITNAPREVVVEMAEDATTEGVKATIDAAVNGASGLAWLTDRKGRQIGFPANQIAYVEVGLPGDDGRIGFG